MARRYGVGNRIETEGKRRGHYKKYKNTLLHAHRSASEWVNTHGKQASIHAYLIENGKCNLEPMLYQSMQQMDDVEGEKNYKRMMKEFRVKKGI